MKRILQIAVLFLPCLAMAQAGTPITVGQWLVLNEASDIHSNDLGCYDPSQVNFATSNLTITMISGSFNCGGFNGSNFSTTQSYKSGSIIFKSISFVPSAGHPIHVEAKIKAGKGWPAFWMLGGNAVAHTGCQETVPQSWDNFTFNGSTCNWSSDASDSAEIDIMEMTQSGGYTFNSEHIFMNGGSSSHSGQNITDATTNFHVYALDWSTTNVCWSVDGVSGGCATDLVPTHPMFVIIENRVLSGSPPPLPQTMTVQYVQVCDGTCSNPGTGGGNSLFFDNFAPANPNPPAPATPGTMFSSLQKHQEMVQ